MRCLVTGGCGFIGSHLCEALVKAGHDVVVLDNLSTGKESNISAVVSQLQLNRGDIRNPADLAAAMTDVDVVFHEAALVSVPLSIDNPRANHDINMTGTLDVLLAARDQGVRRVVFASSAANYGDSPICPKDERMTPEPRSPYAVAKLTGEHYLKVFHDHYGIETVALRYFNVYGPRQDPASPYSGVISLFCDAVLSGKTPTVLGDGLQTRDFIFVDDVAAANLKAAFTPALGQAEVINIGTGVGVSLLQLLETLSSVTGQDIAPTFGQARAGDVRHSLASIDEARRLLDFEPLVPLRDGLSTLIDSLRADKLPPATGRC